ncbi:MAG: hypothetical protein OER90_15295 [Gemmatimonadota bacterium]|nr:hypothetical protein [Gemmatimonadota bacterium]
MARIRALIEDDIPQVAALRSQVFQWRREDSSATREEAIRRVYFHNPFVDASTPSLVLEDAREGVVGFMGVSGRRFRLGDSEVRGAVSSSFMVAERWRGLSGIQLLKQFLAGPQDLAFVDTPNESALDLWARLGTVTAARESLFWVRALRPIRHAVGQLRGGSLSLIARALTRPLAMSLDAFAVRAKATPFHLSVPESREEPLTPRDLVRCLADLGIKGCLVPVYDERMLDWLFRNLERAPKGNMLRKVLVRANTGEVIGWYIRIANPGGVSNVIQLGAREDRYGDLLHHLFYTAWKEGSVALTGRAHGYSWEHLSRRGCVFSRRTNQLLIHTRRSEVLTAFEQGLVHLSRLEGEWWMNQLSDA